MPRREKEISQARFATLKVMTKAAWNTNFFILGKVVGALNEMGKTLRKNLMKEIATCSINYISDPQGDDQTGVENQNLYFWQGCRGAG